MLQYYYVFHIYLAKINHHMKSLMCTELQHTQLLLICVACQCMMTGPSECDTLVKDSGIGLE